MYRSRLFLCCLAALSLIGLPAFAQTPDGKTPAEEAVCDRFKAEGATKGVYGLCVALCEAQDSSEDKGSYNKLLGNYMKKKGPDDPDNPCAVAAPRLLSCPCWSATEAGAVDGVLSDGTDAVGWPAPTSSPSACSANPENSWIQEFNSALTEVAYIQTWDANTAWGTTRRCVYKKMVGGQYVSNIMLSVEFQSMTVEQHAACKADLLARQAALNVCQ